MLVKKGNLKLSKFKGKSPGKILILQTAFLGDVLLSLPLLKNLKSLHPDCQITYICRKGIGHFLTQTGLIESAIEIDKKNSRDMKQLIIQLNSQTWDWLICPHQSFRSQMMSLKIKARYKTSFKNFYNFFIFNDLIEKPQELPEVLRNLSLLESLDPQMREIFSQYLKKVENIEEQTVALTQDQKVDFGLKVDSLVNRIRSLKAVEPKTSMELPHFVDIQQKKATPASASVQMILRKAQGRKIFVLAPGSVWATKMWRVEHYQNLCRHLSDWSFVILIGGPDERNLCASLSEEHESIYNAAGETSLWESAELLASADQVLTNDSGAMHLASLSGVPTLSIFGPTVLEQGYRPWNNQARTIESNIYCRPCGRHGAKKCPLGNHACMKLVTPENVMKEITRKPHSLE